jgi:N-methylhydantoinase B
MSHRVADMTFGALAEIMPDRVMACSQGTSAIMTFGGVDYRTGNRYVSYESVKGGFGARPNKDGINALSSGIANTMNTPIEALEMSFPLRVDCYEVIPNSGGQGKYRGGLGTRRAWTVLEKTARATVCMERTKSAPFGISGGGSGSLGKAILKLPDGTEQNLPSKGAFDVPAGGQVILEAPGSGGYGDKAERDQMANKSDIEDGYVTD